MVRILLGILHGIGALIKLIGHGIAVVAKAIAHGISALFAFIREKFGRGVSIAIKAVILVCILLVAFFGIDSIKYRDKVFPNISVGSVDIGGMSKEDAETAIQAHYAPIVSNATLNIYTSESSQHSIENDEEGKFYTQDNIVYDQSGNALGWICTASEIDAVVPSKTLVEEALLVGRSDGGLLKRVGTMIFGTQLEVTLDINENALESFAYQIDTVIGEPREDSTVVIENGVATAYAGCDGNILNRDELHAKIEETFLSESTEGQTGTLIAAASFAPQRITEEQAEATAQRINDALTVGTTLTYQGLSWSLDAITLGDLIETDIVTQGSESTLAVALNTADTNAELLNDIATVTGSESLRVTFDKDSAGSIVVHPVTSNGSMPDVSTATKELGQALFGEDGLAETAPTSTVNIEVNKVDAPESLSFQDALDAGVISLISTYTTEYSTGTEARETRNYNIHLCSDLVNNTICKADGGQWSFNDTTGECNEEKGFKNAGIIQNGVYTDAYGGGICQVSTTIFNAVFEAGYPVPMRYNHTLYPDNYPAGRDAAVDYGGFNLIWENDTSSDILLTTSYTENTLTANLYGISPRLHVTAETSEWVDGETYGTKTYVDQNLAEGVEYINSTGVDGGQLSVTRTVYNEANEVVRTDVFTSTYEAQDEVRIIGDGTEAAQLVASGQATYLTDDIRAHL